MNRTFRIVYLERLCAERSRVRQALEMADSRVNVTEVESIRELEVCCTQASPDLLVSPLQMPPYEGVQLVEAIQQVSCQRPLLVLVDLEAEALALEALQHGAFDYVLKTPHYLERLPTLIRRVLETLQAQQDLAQAHTALQEYAERLTVSQELDKAVEQSMQQYAERLESLRKIDQAILEAHSTEEIATAALQHLQHLVPCTSMSLLTLDQDTGEATILASHAPTPGHLAAGTRLPLLTLGIVKKLAQGEVHTVSDIAQLANPTPLERRLLADQIHAYAMIPLLIQDELLGALYLGFADSQVVAFEQIEIATEVSSQIVLAFQQARLYEQVQRHAMRLEQHVEDRTAELSAANVKLERIAHELRQLIDTANAPIFGIDAQGRINEWNEAAATITGYSKRDVLGKNLVENFITEEYRMSVRKVLRNALNGIETANFEFPLSTQDGRRILVLLNASARRDEAGNITGVVGVGQDITERMRAESALAWEANVNAVMAELSKALITTASIDDVSSLVLDRAKELTNSRFGFVGFIDPQTGYLVSPTLTHAIWENCQVPNKDFIFQEFRGLWGWVLKNQASLLTNTPDDDPRSTGVPVGHLPIERFLGAPALIGDKIMGEIALANPTRDYTAQDLQLIERLASLYALALERRYAEEELRKLSHAVEQSATVVVITDLEGNIIFVNKAFEESTGYSREEVIGQNPRVLKTEYLSGATYQDLWHTISTGGVWSGEFHNKRKDGTTYWERAVITPITDSTGEIVNYIAIKEDITQQKLAEEALKRAKLEAEAANRLKSEFLANMSHEIRTPMNAILGFTDLLYHDEQDPQKREKLEIIQYSGNHLLNLINDILDFSKIEAGKIEIEPRKFSLSDFFNYLRQQFAVNARKKHLSFEVVLDPNAPSIVIGDEHRLTQVMLNIISNAFKFTYAGTVRVECRYRQGLATIRVTDTGIGIPKENFEAVFAPFVQVDASSTRQHGGTGLGLAITKRLVEMMGGTIMLDSHVDKGSTFTITIPLPAAPDSTAFPKTSPPAPAATSAAAPSPAIEEQPRPVLIVEDNPTNQKLIQVLLKRLSLESDVAENGREALEKLRQHPYDLVLLDMQMPVMDGEEVIKQIRADAALKHLHVIALTAYAMKGDAEKYLHLGCNAYLSKPLDKDQFQEKVLSALSSPHALPTSSATPSAASPPPSNPQTPH
ncbi:PAS domain S-box protein, partial [candidate division KSB3 bacterium]|nr:PAS domain S-box protein [candidate division KSB3 bacterium]MBD3325668.1 PAS domain S-box protein [candidate division KSB3 bacterium]